MVQLGVRPSAEVPLETSPTSALLEGVVFRTQLLVMYQAEQGVPFPGVLRLHGGTGEVTVEATPDTQAAVDWLVANIPTNWSVEAQAKLGLPLPQAAPVVEPPDPEIPNPG